MKTRLFKFTALLLGLCIAYSVINPEGTSSVRYNTLKSFESNSDNFNSKIFPQILCEGCRYCDEDLKENIQNLGNSLEKVRLLRPVTFNYKVKAPVQPAVGDTVPIIEVATVQEANTEIGFIAQEVQQVLPDIVVEGESGHLFIDYIALIPVLVNSIQEQQNQINKLSDEIKQLKELINQ